ncbi:Retrovirus-related Pol polyprotein from transposon RE2, partial [Linum perenne]
MGHHYSQCSSPRQHAPFQPTAHFTYSPEPHPVDSWTLDSGANHHLTNNLANLHLHSEYQGTDQVHLTDDWGGEYQGLSSYLAQHGILEQTSCPHTPEQNGCAECKHRHITETGRTLLHHDAVPLEYWTYAFQTAAYLINRLPRQLPSTHLSIDYFQLILITLTFVFLVAYVFLGLN